VEELQDRGSGVECSKMGGRTNVHEEERNGRPSVMNDGCSCSEC
jgi:hypothetical protein